MKICDKLIEKYLSDEKITKSELKKNLNTSRKSDADQILDGVLKHIIPTIFNEFQQLVASSDNKMEFNDLFKRIVIITFSIPKIRKFLDEYLNDY